MKVHKFDNKDPITVLRFRSQLKHACDSNGVSAGLPLWVMRNFMIDGLSSSLTVRMTPRGDAMGDYSLAKVGEEQITTYVEAMNYLFKF